VVPCASASRQAKAGLIELPGAVGFDHLVNRSAYATDELEAEMPSEAQSMRAQCSANDRGYILSAQQPQKVENVGVDRELFSVMPRLAGGLRDQEDRRTPVQDRRNT
jgi:hypothetical protein